MIAELDDEAETFGAISEGTWLKHRHRVRREISQAAKLAKALEGLAKMLSHYTYAKENRDALAFAKATLAEYAGSKPPEVENPTND